MRPLEDCRLADFHLLSDFYDRPASVSKSLGLADVKLRDILFLFFWCLLSGINTLDDLLELLFLRRLLDKRLNGLYAVLAEIPVLKRVIVYHLAGIDFSPVDSYISDVVGVVLDYRTAAVAFDYSHPSLPSNGSYGSASFMSQ